MKINDATWRYIQVYDVGDTLGGIQHLFVYIDGVRLGADDDRWVAKYSADDGGVYWVFRASIGSLIGFATDAPDASDGYYFNVYAAGIKILDASGYGMYDTYESGDKFRVYDTMQVSIEQ